MNNNNPLQNLITLRTHDSHEFRFQMNSLLKNMLLQENPSLPQNFKDILSSFKKEFIQDSFFYIDELNLILKKIALKNRSPIQPLIHEILFIVQIGDIQTHSILKKIIRNTKDPYIKSQLLEAQSELHLQITKYQKYSQNYKLHPIIEIVDDWID